MAAFEGDRYGPPGVERLKMKFRRAAILVIASLSMSRLAFPVDPATDIATGAQKTSLQKTIETCAACHGLNGRSISPTYPNLAAQSAPYIELQLHAFKDQTRADPDAQAYMWGMASQLDDGSISSLAAYFAKQSPAAGKIGNATAIAQGKKIFVEGVPAHQIPGCAACHGLEAQGQGPFPRLAGQHAPYLLKQLLVIQSALRAAPVMHGIVKDLSRDEMQAVVTYLESI
ncbi:MAG TPA: c-type cytochrome [Steroidobacteraceae bacterium]|jgi:cytochrome c553|nr:c-type cytochrome [Steroidobacteraceae bacterium]